MRGRSVVCIAALILVCPAAYGATLTFDEVPSGTVLWDSPYAYSHRVWFSQDFRATDHRGSSWGPPHSGSNVLASVGDPDFNPRVLFGYYTTSEADRDPIQAVGAYFCTQTGAMVRVTAYHWIPPATTVAVASVVIGAPGESWNNRYVEISSSPGSPFERLEFEGVNSPDDLLGFSADDMTITPIPEPGSLVLLAGGLAGMGASLLRRRR